MLNGFDCSFGAVSVQNIPILVVEDDGLILMDIEQTLQDGGYDTLAEVSGEAAIARLESELRIRALVTDINLKSKATGWDVARRGRELYPNLPVIYATSVPVDEWSSKGVPNSLLISKPFAPAQITTAISQLLNEGGAPSGSNR